MQGFEDVTISWAGKSYVIPANRQMGLIARLEDALSGDSGQQAISVLMRKEGPPYSRLAAAFGAALRYAGANVGDDEVYLSITEDMANSAADLTAKLQACVIALLMVISPPIGKKLMEPAKKDDTEKKG